MKLSKDDQRGGELSIRKLSMYENSRHIVALIYNSLTANIVCTVYDLSLRNQSELC